jgi:hypothetical protein
VPWLLSGGASLPLLRDAAGFHTVYGYPRPYGDASPDALAELASALRTLAMPVRVALHPCGRGDALSRLLRDAAATRTSRPICIAELSGKDPLEHFSSTARSKVRRGGRLVTALETTPLKPEFGDLYRNAMSAADAEPVYFFDDAYLRRLASLDHIFVTAADEHGVAAQALFLLGEEFGTYHLSARRTIPPPAAGAVNLIVLEGLREASRRGLPYVLLGGGRERTTEDPLFVFKRSMATRVVVQDTLLLQPASLE